MTFDGMPPMHRLEDLEVVSFDPARGTYMLRVTDVALAELVKASMLRGLSVSFDSLDPVLLPSSRPDVAAAAAAAVEERVHAERETEAARLLAPTFEAFAGRRRQQQAALAAHRQQAAVYLRTPR